MKLCCSRPSGMNDSSISHRFFFSSFFFRPFLITRRSNSVPIRFQFFLFAFFPLFCGTDGKEHESIRNLAYCLMLSNSIQQMIHSKIIFKVALPVGDLEAHPNLTQGKVRATENDFKVL